MSCMSTWHKSDPEYNPQLFGTLFRDLVMHPWSFFLLRYLSVMAAYVVLHIRIVNMGLQTAYAREIPDRVKAIGQYSRSFVYCRKLACSTVSLTGDRVRGDDSKQYMYYENTYSTFQGFFSPARSPPRRIVLSPLQSRSPVHREPPRFSGGILNYLYKRIERQSYPPKTTADPLTWEF